MKYFVVALCLLLGSAAAVPVKQHTSALDLLRLLENVVEDDGHLLLSKVVNLIHKVEEAVVTLKEAVPKVYEKIHQEADEVLAGLKKVGQEVEELLGKKTGNVYYGFDLLNGLTELTGGTKLSTVLSLLSLAEKAHRVINDAREFVPHLEKTLDRIQIKITTHVTDLAHHVVKELGIEGFVAHSVVNRIEDLVKNVEDEAHVLIFDLLHKIEQTFALLKEELPELYEKVEERVEEIRLSMHTLVDDIQKTLLFRSASILDFAGDLTGGTSLGTAFKVMSLIDKFNTVIQDVRGFGPHAEVVLERSVKKVADSAQDFLKHTADILTKSM